MKQKAAIRLISLFFTLAFLCQPFLAAPSPAAKPSTAGTVIGQQDILPHAELDRTHLPVVAVAHLLVQKTISQGVQQLVASAGGSADVLQNFQIRESALLIKEYLFHIYPYHHFW